MSCDFFTLATKGVQSLQPYQPGKPLEELEREYGITQAIKLASNENPLGTSPWVLIAVQNHLNQLARYPDGNGFKLKRALARQYEVSPDSITLGNGSNDVLELIARAFVSSSDAVMFSQYAFAVYPLITQAIGAQAIVVQAKNWGHDLTAMLTAITENTRLIFIANPNNPTGTWVTKNQLKTFLETVPQHILVTVDEAYFEYAQEHPDYPNSLNWLAEYPNLIVTRTFSKGYGLAGLRVGYAISHPDVANLLNRVRQPFNVNQLALVAAEVALQEQEHLEKTVLLNRYGMQQMTAAMKTLGFNFIPSLGNFISIEVGDGAKVFDKLLRQGVITRPLAAYAMPQHLRVTVGTERENERFIQALTQVFT
jgi:histidinol-phosphate aminotransferase